MYLTYCPPQTLQNLVLICSKGVDGHVRGAVLKVPSKGTQPTFFRQPLKFLYQLEGSCEISSNLVEDNEKSTVQSER